MKTDGGFVLIYRRILNNVVFHNDQEAYVFILMLLDAQWREAWIETKYGDFRLFPGEVLIAENTLARRTGLSRSAVHRLLVRMAKANMICADHERAPNLCGTVVAITNYREYQGFSRNSEDVLNIKESEGEHASDILCSQNKEENQGNHIKTPVPTEPVSAAADLFPSAGVIRLPDPVEKAVEAWNATALSCGLSQVRNLTQARRSSLRLRLKDCGGLDGWTAALEQVRASSFLLGENDRGWKADFDFIIQPKKFAKLREGAYANRATGKRRHKLDGLERFLGPVDAWDERPMEAVS